MDRRSNYAVGKLLKRRIDMGNRTSKSQEQYLFNVARTVCGKIGGVNIDEVGVYHDSDEFPQQFWRTYEVKVARALSLHGPESLGRIVAAGKGHEANGHLCHFDMDLGRHLNAAHDGDFLLLLLASRIVGAKIADMMRQDLRYEEHKERVQADLLERAMHHG
jgi:hypothetical protein